MSMTPDPGAHRLLRSARAARLDAVLLVKVGVAVYRKSECRLAHVEFSQVTTLRLEAEAAPLNLTGEVWVREQGLAHVIRPAPNNRSLAIPSTCLTIRRYP